MPDTPGTPDAVELVRPVEPGDSRLTIRYREGGPFPEVADRIQVDGEVQERFWTTTTVSVAVYRGMPSRSHAAGTVVRERR